MPTPDPLRSWIEAFVAEPSFLARYPYYAAILSRLVPVADPAIEVMAVSLQSGVFYLHVNEEHFVAAPEDLRGVLLHEVHHVVLGHLTEPKFAGVAHPDLMELAQEVSANEHIEEHLPDPLTWRDFQAIEHGQLRAGQSTMERYERLVRAFRGESKPSIRSASHGKKNVDDHPWSDDLASARRGSTTVANLVTHAVAALRAQDPSRDLDDPLVRLDRRFRLAGHDVGRLIEELGGVHAPPEIPIDWVTAITMFIAQQRAPSHTWSRPSRRAPEQIGRIPGRRWTTRADARPHLFIAIDTSMSMLEHELVEVARQLRPLSDHARLTVAECDVEVHRVAPFTGELPRVHGRGGTDLRPIFEPDRLASVGAEGVVYFTDGVGPYPETPPPVPTLWVLTKDAPFHCPWGAKVRLGKLTVTRP